MSYSYVTRQVEALSLIAAQPHQQVMVLEAL
jgi:hypothetical protein